MKPKDIISLNIEKGLTISDDKKFKEVENWAEKICAIISAHVEDVCKESDDINNKIKKLESYLSEIKNELRGFQTENARLNKAYNRKVTIAFILSAFSLLITILSITKWLVL